jgi:hypothetical protein
MKASEYVKQFTDPFYQWFEDYGLFIIIVICAFIFLRISIWVIKVYDANKWRKAPYGNTNTWFNIEVCKNVSDSDETPSEN